jgi:hypothetical protein
MSDDPTKKSARDAFAVLQWVMRQRPLAMFQRVGGEVGFAVVFGDDVTDWTVRADGQQVSIVEGRPSSPAVTIGIQLRALRWLVEGTLDVPKAFADHRIAIKGDSEAFAKFVACFALPEKSLGVLSSQLASRSPRKK